MNARKLWFVVVLSLAALGQNAQGQAYSVRVTGFEVTQGINNLFESVPLIAGKKTLARVFVQVHADRPVPPNSKAFVNGSLLVDTLPSSIPVAPIQAASVFVDAPFDTFYVEMKDLTETLDFVLPDAVTNSPGTLFVTLTNVGVSSAETGAPLFCDCPDSSLFQAGTLIKIPPLKVHVHWQDWTTAPDLLLPQISFPSRQVDIDLLKAWLQRAYPQAT